MIICMMCLEEFPSPDGGIEVFAEEGLNLDVQNIIAKHFWFKPTKTAIAREYICKECWNTINIFHQFYQRVCRAHRRLQEQLPFVVIPSETDPLPRDNIPQGVEMNSTVGQLIDTLGDHFFDSEVKVEVNDLDLLPQVEIIEDPVTTITNISDRAQRANRRGYQMRDKSPLFSKRIKREESPYSSSRNDGNETESELPLDVLLGGGLKTDTDLDESENHIMTDDGVDTKPDLLLNPLEKKRRGRPKKIKEELPDQSTASIINSQANDANAIKTEKLDNDGDNDHANDNHREFGSGTEDSVSSSSSEDSDSDDSLPDATTEEKYAKIPKRVVIKPKKYRKRPKPQVQPRRMTREEIDRKKARQVEYDKVISKFFEKFICPKCDLLVKNFGEMCQHFRMSHNSEPGYMTCCGRKFHQRKTLAEHVYVHCDPEHFKCSTCARTFPDARALDVHAQTHTNPPEVKEKKVFKCEKCPKVFTTKAAYEYHSFSKHVPKSEFKFTCPECNKKLPTERKLKDHVKYMHDPESAIICDKCGKQVRSQSNLKKHHQIEHSDAPRPAPVPVQCEMCGTWLRHLAGLKQHMKTIHEDSGGEHRCHICNKTSTNARALKRHIYHNHECERKFKCTMCEKAFKRPQDLREHTSTHTGEVLYTCPNCPMTFFSNANMYKHRQRLHRSEWEADKKKPVPPNIMQQAVGATAAMKMQQAVGKASAFFACKQNSQ